jgi:hypothetical protein
LVLDQVEGLEFGSFFEISAITIGSFRGRKHYYRHRLDDSRIRQTFVIIKLDDLEIFRFGARQQRCKTAKDA